MATVHFLLVYDLSKERLVSQDAFDKASEAVMAYAQLEAEHRNDPNVEIVLVGADSIETVMRTHAQYFARSPEGVSSYLVAEPAGR